MNRDLAGTTWKQMTRLLGAFLLVGGLMVAPAQAEDIEDLESDLAFSSQGAEPANANVQVEPQVAVTGPTSPGNTGNPSAPYGWGARDNHYTDALYKNLSERYYQVDHALGQLAGHYQNINPAQNLLSARNDGKQRFHYYSWHQNNSYAWSLLQWVQYWENWLRANGRLYPQNYLAHRNYWPYNQYYGYNPWYRNSYTWNYQPYYYPNYTRYRVSTRMYWGYYGPRYSRYYTYRYSYPQTSLSLGLSNGLSLSLNGY